MSAKWLIIAVLGTLGVFRALQPAFFNHWFKGKFQLLFESRSSVGTHLLMGLVASIFAGLSGMMIWPQAPWYSIFAVLPVILTARLVWMVGLAFLLRPKGSAVVLSGGYSYAATALAYFWTVVLVFTVQLFGSTYNPYAMGALAFGHLIGLLWFALLSPAFQNLKEQGLRFYAILYLCTLEVILIYLFAN